MITTEEMRAFEDEAEKQGISKLKLMENAGRAAFETIKKRYGLMGKKILVVCGHGNNGGDGFVLAKYLLRDKIDTTVLFLGDPKKLKRESGFNYHFLNDMTKGCIKTDIDDFSGYDIIIDAMLGTGVSGNIREPYATAIDKINSSEKLTVSLDIPTGIDPDSGKKLDKAVNADLIITFHDIKSGLKHLEDKVEIVDIGIPSRS